VTERQRELVRERVRRWRERAKSGLACITLELDVGAIGDWLRDAGVIGGNTEDDPGVIASGLEKMLTKLVTRYDPD
jgi:hypothetical protein